MGDMRETFDALKAHTAERKAKREAANVDALLRETGIVAREQSKNVWRVDTPAGAVMYYPATNCWQHKGKTFRGDVQGFINWFFNTRFVRPA